MRYLGLDLGTKTLGVAITDKTNTLSSPLKTIRFAFEDYDAALNEVKDIIINNNITEIALGMPINMDGTKGFASERSLKFKKLLEETFSDIKITLIDERLSSISAHNILKNICYILFFDHWIMYIPASQFSSIKMFLVATVLLISSLIPLWS